MRVVRHHFFGPPDQMFEHRYPGGGNFDVYYHHGSHPLAWVIFGLLVVILVCVAALLVLRLVGSRRPGKRHGVFAGGPPEPLGLLRLRYARGEISRDEFAQASQDLRGGPAPLSEPPPA